MSASYRNSSSRSVKTLQVNMKDKFFMRENEDSKLKLMSLREASVDVQALIFTNFFDSEMIIRGKHKLMILNSNLPITCNDDETTFFINKFLKSLYVNEYFRVVGKKFKVSQQEKNILAKTELSSFFCPFLLICSSQFVYKVRTWNEYFLMVFSRFS